MVFDQNKYMKKNITYLLLAVFLLYLVSLFSYAAYNHHRNRLDIVKTKEDLYTQ